MKKGCKNDFDFSRKINEGNEVETIIHFESVLSTIEAKKILIHFRQNSKILKSFYPLNQDSFEFINGGKSVEYSWLELKHEFIYDKIKDIL